MFKDIVTQWSKLAILLALLAVASRTSRAADEPLKPDELMRLLKASRSAESSAKPKFKQDGDDLVITLEILINGCADVHSTSWKEDAGVYYLHYSVVQNLDSYVRNVQSITLEWRLKKHKMGDESKYPVTGAYWAPTTDELKASGPELKKLMMAKAPTKDFTNVKAAELGVRPVEAKKDERTGFVVGGKNATALVKTLTQINGRSIEALEEDMRPGTISAVGSTLGFLGPKERLLDVLAADNRFVVDELGLTHQELAIELRVMAAIGAKLGDQEFIYHGRRYKVTGLKWITGAQASPFHDGTSCGGQNPTVHNLTNGKKISYSMLVPHMIERYGFYEGKGTPFRRDPRRIIEVLDFIKAGVEQKLVGTWVVSDADKKQGLFTDLRFKADGTCGVVLQVGALADAKYRIIGKQLVINQQSSNGSTSWEFRIESVTETELVVEQRFGRLMVKVRYVRAK